MAGELTTQGVYAVSYYEDAEGYRETWREDGVEVVRTCRVRWDLRGNFLADMLGWTEADPDPNTGRLKRHLPEKHPTYSWLYAMGADMKGWRGIPGQDSQGRLQIDERTAAGAAPTLGASAGNGWAVYEVTYRPPDAYMKQDDEISSELERFVVRDYRFAIENLTLPGQGFKYGTAGETGQPAGTAIPAGVAGKTIPGQTIRPFPTMTIQYTWRQLPQINLDKIQAAMGKVNSATFDNTPGVANTGFGAETLLFHSVEARRKRHATSDYYFELVFSFLYRATGWNKLYHRSESTFFKVVDVAGSGNGIYQTYAFADLFKFN